MTALWVDLALTLGVLFVLLSFSTRAVVKAEEH
jgi:hypothetical protein